MKLNDRIRSLRELNRWSQEEMAERMHMSKNGYARIERGESKLNLERLEQIAAVFDIDMVELITRECEPAIFLIGGNTGNNTNYYNHNDTPIGENEKLKLMLAHKEELLAQKDIIIEQKDNEIAALKALLAVLQKTDTR